MTDDNLLDDLPLGGGPPPEENEEPEAQETGLPTTIPLPDSSETPTKAGKKKVKKKVRKKVKKAAEAKPVPEPREPNTEPEQRSQEDSAKMAAEASPSDGPEVENGPSDARSPEATSDQASEDEIASVQPAPALQSLFQQPAITETGPIIQESPGTTPEDPPEEEEAPDVVPAPATLLMLRPGETVEHAIAAQFDALMQAVSDGTRNAIWDQELGDMNLLLHSERSDLLRPHGRFTEAQVDEIASWLATHIGYKLYDPKRARTITNAKAIEMASAGNIPWAEIRKKRRERFEKMTNLR